MKQQKALKWAGLAAALLALVGLSGWALDRWYPAPVDALTDLVHPTTYEFKTDWMKEQASIVYPAEARRHNVEGSTVVSMLVEADGKISHTEVFGSSGHAILDEAALAAAQKFKIDPSKLDADEFPFEKLLKLTFRLEDLTAR